MRTGFADFLSIARMAAAIPFSRGAIHRFFWPAICAALICIVASAQDPTPVLPRIAQDQLTALASRVGDQEGRATRIEVTRSSDDGLARKAIEAVRSWKFKPARDQEGHTVAVVVPIEVTFRLY